MLPKLAYLHNSYSFTDHALEKLTCPLPQLVNISHPNRKLLIMSKLWSFQISMKLTRSGFIACFVMGKKWHFKNEFRHNISNIMTIFVSLTHGYNPERVNFIQIWKNHKLGEGLAHLAMYNTTMRNAGNPKYEASVLRSKSALYILILWLKSCTRSYTRFKQGCRPPITTWHTRTGRPGCPPTGTRFRSMLGWPGPDL